MTMTKQIHLAAHFPGVNNTTVWSDPAAGSHIEFDSFASSPRPPSGPSSTSCSWPRAAAARAERADLRPRRGRPARHLHVLAALAAVTERLGLTGTINSTFNEPYEVARQFASLDHLSGGRAAWNVVTSWDAFTGENFRRGGFLAQDDRYERARSSTGERAVGLLARRRDPRRQGVGQFLADGGAGAFEHQDAFFDIAGQFNVPRSPQGRPVIFQAGDSDEGREFAAASADAIFSRHGTLEDGPGVLRRRQGPAGQVRPDPRTSC
jgi:alkanesulfonate monooxygenase SsuD/methylene tetrahydromethanopterin reductase-like flavin-dependent oxidoreductase (luciferase family)